MGMGNGAPIDSEAILQSVEQIHKQLDKGFVKVRYKYQKGGQFGQWLGNDVRVARVTVAPGIHQKGAYFDIQWWENGDYKYHYREEGLQFRFGREEANQSTNKPVRHFHPPNDINAHNQSCIESGHPPQRVTIAVVKTWWTAVEKKDETIINTQNGLP